MTLTIDSITIKGLIGVSNTPLDLEFREKRRVAGGKLRVKQRVSTNKLIKQLNIAYLTKVEFDNIKTKLNSDFFNVTLTGSGSDFSGSFEIELLGYQDSFNGSKKGVILTLNPE